MDSAFSLSSSSSSSSANGTSMVHCSPILPNPMASLLHDLSSSDSSTASSPLKHSLVFARTLAFAFSVSPTIVTAHPYQGPDEENFFDGFKDKPDEHPQPQQQQRQEQLYQQQSQ
ncbi:hypothetical protein EC957_010974 [Mortierella hygrophila]|uniref:Uncharacterized protein n=1 Tax=Mortierella hygrophila TaxID=979708 RepID=A0A9P6F9G2_9FUNG|nr:hypothetical protein EC957_010974 [Mortierella hygrophila]